jgi:nitroimidazol reductase NimA-like FMN-containing flavoprotein (pyridoxamine 5'-phosphate oxidase superfamily)
VSAPIAALAEDEVEALLREEVVGRIGCHAGGETYVVPIVYAYDGEAVYVASREGRKLRMMRENPAVCFEVDRYERGSWRSVIAQGRFEELDGAGAERALDLLAARFAGRPTAPRDRSLAVCFRIVLAERSGRAVSR